MTRPYAWFPFLMVACGMLALAGCWGSEAPAPPKHDIHIRGLWHVYFEYMSKGYHAEGTKDAAELKKWAAENTTPERLKKMAVYDLDAAFTSPRDNLPYVLRNFKKSEQNGGVVIHETKGLNGKRFVAYGRGGIGELNESEFRAALK